MKRLKQSSQFKKDLKRIKHNPKKIEKLRTILELLKESGTIPSEYNPHLLIGQYK